jgi:hypothetical protein
MRRTTAILATTTLALATLTACGSGDDDAAPAATDAPATDEPATDEPAPDEPATDEPATDDPATEEPAADEEVATDDTGDDESSGPVIDSLDEVPPECRDLMAGYLRDLEPIVSPVDWSNATLNEFETISGAFEARAMEFETDSAEAGCDDLNFAEDDDGFDLIIEFARDVAPGTVPFFEFLNTFLDSTGTGGDDSGDGDSASGSIATCDDAIAAIQSLMDEYDTFADVPVSDMMVMTEIGTAMMSCSPEQLDFFDSDAVNDFLGE